MNDLVELICSDQICAEIEFVSLVRDVLRDDHWAIKLAERHDVEAQDSNERL